MKTNTVRLLIPVFAAAFVGACSDKNAEASQRNIELPPPPATTSQPVLHDAPVTQVEAKAPSRPTPPPPKRPTPTPVPAAAQPVPVPPTVTPPVAPPAAPPAPVYATIPAGTMMAVMTAAKACTNTQKVGDRVVASVVDPVSGTSGAVIPSGATVTFEVTESQYGKNDEKAVRFHLRPTSVAFDGNTYPLEGATVDSFRLKTVRRQSTGTQAGKVAAGAAIGAIIGKVAGKSTGATVVGGAAGAAGGAMVAAGTADYDGCVLPDQRLSLSLGQALRLHAQ